jgi:hypothetical protein
MLSFHLRPSHVVTGLMSLSFAAEEGSSAGCAAGDGERVVYFTTIENTTWGIRLQSVWVSFSCDTQGISLCPWLSTTECQQGQGAFLLRIPDDIDQEYWAGDEKRVEVRACCAPNHPCADYNVQCRIEAKPVSRDPSGNNGSCVAEAHLHVKRR